RIANPMQPNTTIYTVSFTYQNPAVANNQLFSSTAPVIYKPEDTTLTSQPRATGDQYLSGKYYHVRNYTHFIDIVNKEFPQRALQP
ncbi:MAG: hypothetical protein ACKPKO_06190, partial [Candidatus Fonsibacter sp.]